MQKFDRNFILIGIVVLIAMSIRVWGVDFGLPYMYHPDEPNKIIMAQQMFKTKDFNPHYFLKPTLFIYLNALAYVPFYFLGKGFGAFSNPGDILPPVVLAMGVVEAPTSSVVLMGRLLTVLFATASIPLIYLIGKEISGNYFVGLLAAFMMAISPTNVANSRYITANSFLVFFILLVIWASIRIYQQGDTKYFIMAGIVTGLAASSKYPGITIGVLPLVAYLLSAAPKSIKDFRIYLYLIYILIAFFATTPFALLDYQKFLQDTLYEVTHYSTGHSGMEGNSFIWYLNFMWRTAGIIYIFAVLGIMYGIYIQSKEIMLLSVFPVIYFIFISSFIVRNDRTFLPMTPFMFLLAAWFFVHLLNRAKILKPKALHRIAFATIACMLLVSLALPATKTIRDTIKLTTIDSRETARVWINNNLPSGSRLAIESYSPFVDPVNFAVRGVLHVIDHNPEWYIENGFDYLVFSEGMFGRFYREPEKYNSQVSQYEAFFDRFTLVRMFTDGGYEVRVYATK